MNGAGLVQRAGRLIRPSRCATSDRRSRSRLARRQPHRAAIHRRLCRDLLYATLAEFGFARGRYEASADDGLELVDCRITNAVRCVPPENKPTPQEIAACRDFLFTTTKEMKKLCTVLALGRVAHETFLAANGERRAAFPFGHGRTHTIGTLTFIDSYHCSRYNTNTGVLTPQMFRDVIAQARKRVDLAAAGADS